MWKLSEAELLERVRLAIEAGGRTVLVDEAAHPFVLRVEDASVFLRVRVHIGNLTRHDARGRDIDEFQVQVAGEQRFSASNVDRTLILGWWERGGTITAWHSPNRTESSGGATSRLISGACLRAAATARICTQRVGHDEIVLAFAPAFLGDYVAHQPAIHELGSSRQDLHAFEDMLANPASPQPAIARATTEASRALLAKLASELREAVFRERVLGAYDHACSMCGLRLRLIDAARIVPAREVDGDATCNGIALCALHRRAFDRALVTMDEEYFIVLNPDRASWSTAARAGTPPEFRSKLRALLALPPAIRDRPLPDLIREGNRLRGWKNFARVA